MTKTATETKPLLGNVTFSPYSGLDKGAVHIMGDPYIPELQGISKEVLENLEKLRRAPSQEPAGQEPETPAATHVRMAYHHLVSAFDAMGYPTQTDPNFDGTALRAAKALEELILPRKEIEEEVKRHLSTHFPTRYDGMVTRPDIFVSSLCPHHLLPVILRVTIGYIPYKNDKGTPMVVGLSKIDRVVELLGKQPIMQEEFTFQLIEAFDTFAKTLGTAVHVRGWHGCMAMRGVKSRDAITITSDVSGLFLDNAATRGEFQAYARQHEGPLL